MRRLWTVASAAMLALGVASPAVAAVPSGAAATGDLTRWVNPMIGTSAGGDTFPGATMPFGMTQPSPDTPSQPAGGGYSYNDSSIEGFSTVHISGPGCGALGHVSLMPVTGALTSTTPSQYASPFAHSSETAQAGYYAVDLTRYGVHAELTATDRTAAERYTFPQNTGGTVLINLGAAQNTTSDAQVRIVNDHTIEGYQSTGAFCGGNRPVTVYFTAHFNRPFITSGTWNNGGVSWGSTAAQGTAIGAAAHFDTSVQRDVVARIGVSYVSLAGARANLASEEPNNGFASLRNQAHTAWNQMLHRVAVTGGTDVQRTNFYTSLYHALIQPNLFSDSDGRYVGMDGAVHNAAGRKEYTNLSLWDTYRDQFQLLSLVAPDVARDVGLSMISDTKELGWVPRWVLANVETNVMSGDPAPSVFAYELAAGLITPAELAPIYPILKANATQAPPAGNPAVGRVGIDFYRQHGYVPYNPNVYMERSAASATLEWALADNSMAAIAKALGQNADATDFSTFAHSYRNIFDPSTGFFRPRYADGSWLTPFDPAHETAPWQDGQGFDEGSAWQYLWLVPEDTSDLATLLGGTQAALAKANQFFAFDQVTADPSKAKTLWNGGAYYNPTNEIDLQAPYVYDALGAAWKTQRVVRATLDSVYTPTPGGIPGNDDLGTMSSWYVLSALGLYPYTAGEATFALTSPLFDKAVVEVPGQTGRGPLVIDAPNAGNRPFVTALTVNGRAQNSPWVSYQTLRDGAHLTYTLSATQDPSWGSGS